MINKCDFYINGAWVAPIDGTDFPVLNPATEEAYALISLGGSADAEAAIKAARETFPSWSMTTPRERAEYLKALLAVYEARSEEMAQSISTEMGAPIDMSIADQASAGRSHLKAFLRALDNFEWSRPVRPGMEGQDLVHEAAGVAALITPWNWPMNQVVLKVGAALAAGCTMVLKPSEIAPMSSVLFAEMVHEAGLPAGVFNMVNGDGAGVGTILSSHPDIDVVSFTGSTRAGILISKAAADTVKTVSLELGGKSPNLVFADAGDMEAAADATIGGIFRNAGQVCVAGSRLMVEQSVKADFIGLLNDRLAGFRTGDPLQLETQAGAINNAGQLARIAQHVDDAASQGADILTGGHQMLAESGGYYYAPTILDKVDRDSSIFQSEVFGPVLSVTTFEDEAEAVALANGTDYGLAAAIFTRDLSRAHRMVREIKAGVVHVNCYGGPDITVPLSGMKQSGNGSDKSLHALDKFTDLKTAWIAL